MYSGMAVPCKHIIGKMRGKCNKRKSCLMKEVGQMSKSNKKDIEVKVTFTEGYQKRFTEACLQVIQKRRDGIQQEINHPKKAAG